MHTLGSAQPQIAKAGGAGILWAEEGAGPWEAFISGHPAKRARSRTIAADTVERLGGRVEWRRFADGGYAAGSPRGITAAPAVNVTTVDLATVQAAVAGMAVVMDGQAVGRLVTAHQGAARANGMSRR